MLIAVFFTAAMLVVTNIKKVFVSSLVKKEINSQRMEISFFFDRQHDRRHENHLLTEDSTVKSFFSYSLL